MRKHSVAAFAAAAILTGTGVAGADSGSPRCPARTPVDTYLHAVDDASRDSPDLYLRALHAVDTTGPYKPVLNRIGNVEADPRCGYTTGPHHGRYGNTDQDTWAFYVARAGFSEYVDVLPEDTPPVIQDAAAVALIDAGGLGRSYGWAWAARLRVLVPEVGA